MGIHLCCCLVIFRHTYFGNIYLSIYKLILQEREIHSTTE